jgi:Phytanoyl-CoA dioxygenase (PhyH)
VRRRETQSPAGPPPVYGCVVLGPERLREFADRGFVVIPQVVPPELVVAASRTIDAVIARRPPGDDVRGNHFYWPKTARVPALGALLTASPAFSLTESLTGPGTLQVPPQVQVALNIPPFPHRPGGHHIDGFPPEADGRPGTFTLLAGVLMSDQRDEDAGNLWVWPGTHLAHAAYFRDHGPDAFFEAAGYPPIPLPEPEQVRGRAGDLLLAHYLLGHNIGGNTSDTVRRAVYFRVKRFGHDPRWREFLPDAWLDYDPIRALPGTA